MFVKKYVYSLSVYVRHSVEVDNASVPVTDFVVSMSSPMSTPAGDRGGWHVHKIRTWSGSPITISIPSFMHACNRPSEFCMHNDAIYPTAMQEEDENSSKVDHIDSGDSNKSY